MDKIHLQAVGDLNSVTEWKVSNYFFLFCFLLDKLEKNSYQNPGKLFMF